MGSRKARFITSVPQTSNGAFYVSYVESCVTYKFELNTTVLDSGRFEVRKNPIFHNSSRSPQMMRYVLVTRLVLVTLRAAYPANLSSKRRF